MNDIKDGLPVYITTGLIIIGFNIRNIFKRIAKYDKYIPKIINYSDCIPRSVVSNRFLIKCDETDVGYILSSRINCILRSIADYIVKCDDKCIFGSVINYIMKRDDEYIFRSINNYYNVKDITNTINTLIILKEFNIIIYVILIMLKMNVIF